MVSPPILLQSIKSFPSLRSKTSFASSSTTENADLLDGHNRPPRNRLRGDSWRRVVVSAGITVTTVLVLNMVFLIFSVAKFGRGEDGMQVLFTGNCGKTSKINTAVHLVINLFSTILLGASNYCMQCLSAPTRKEINSAHAKGQWLDIGVPSFRNLARISKQRVVLWSLLGLSSLPLHLFYNSAVFSSIAAFNYDVYTVNEAFVNRPKNSSYYIWAGMMNQRYTWMSSDSPNITRAIDSSYLYDISKAAQQLSLRPLENLTAAQCVQAYSQDFQTSRQQLMLVVDNDENIRNSSGKSVIMTNSGLYSGGYVDNWVCNQAHATYEKRVVCSQYKDSIIKSLGSDSKSWKPFDIPVKYCLSDLKEEKCTLYASLTISILVLILNFFKAVMIWWFAFKVDDSPLLTIGDAVALFISSPDPWTSTMCLASKEDFRNMKSGKPFSLPPKTFTEKRERWSKAVSAGRWAAWLIIFFTGVIAISVLLSVGVKDLRTRNSANARSIWDLGIGAVHSRTIISWEVPSLVGNVVMANLAQPILSFIYFTYNGLFTAMASAHEWSKYAVKRKGLRVSFRPRKEQRTKYFLELPYRFSLPLMAISGLLHWLASQSIFFVHIQYLYSDTSSYTTSLGNSGSSQMSCGYSPLGIILFLTASICMFLFLVAISFRRFASTMPVVGSCSAAIAAACHPGESDEPDAAFAKLQWGVTDMYTDTYGHCGFSTSEVTPPKKGNIYT